MSVSWVDGGLFGKPAGREIGVKQLPDRQRLARLALVLQRIAAGFDPARHAVRQGARLIGRQRADLGDGGAPGAALGGAILENETLCAGRQDQQPKAGQGAVPYESGFCAGSRRVHNPLGNARH